VTEIADSSSRNAVSFSSARTMKCPVPSRSASAIEIVHCMVRITGEPQTVCLSAQTVQFSQVKACSRARGNSRTFRTCHRLFQPDSLPPAAHSDRRMLRKTDNFDVLSGVTSGRISRSKKSGARERLPRNDPSDQSLPKVRNRHPSRRA
jgi:hypothetical protein